jgi:hypothetical protein
MESSGGFRGLSAESKRRPMPNVAAIPRGWFAVIFVTVMYLGEALATDMRVLFVRLLPSIPHRDGAITDSERR